MAKKRTKADKLQRIAERPEERDDVRREFEINDKQSEPARTTLDLAALEEQIRLRASELYEARGREAGHEVEDWLQAEAEILGVQRKANRRLKQPKCARKTLPSLLAGAFPFPPKARSARRQPLTQMCNSLRCRVPARLPARATLPPAKRY